MSDVIENLINNSKLPGKRANLELMWRFAENSSDEEIDLCLSYKDYNLDNTPEEFVVMCGVVGFSVRHKDNPKVSLEKIEDYADSPSWRVREATAMGIQELLIVKPQETIRILDEWALRNERYKRCIVAGLCEPKNLKDEYVLASAFKYLVEFTEEFNSYDIKLTEDQKILRKALGYAWSVAIVEDFEKGKLVFEKFLESDNKNIRWIVKNNLKKNRLVKIDKEWVEGLLEVVK